MATGHNETDTPEAQFLAHQLMQPVTAADNYAAALLELLHGGRLTPEKLEEGLAKIKSQTEKALGTAKALRALTRAQTTAAGRALFSEAFKAGLTRVQTLFPAFSCPAEGLCGTNVVCDPVLLEELLFNLLKTPQKPLLTRAALKPAQPSRSRGAPSFSRSPTPLRTQTRRSPPRRDLRPQTAKKAAAARDSLSCGAFWRPAEDASH